MQDTKHTATVWSYVFGFAMSVVFTVEAYLATTRQHLGHRTFLLLLASLALAQAVVQLLFFLHLDREGKPRWKLVVFSFMLLVVIIVVAGSLWIMNNVSYHHAASPGQVKSYLKNQDAL